jgi:hypothetical protein
MLGGYLVILGHAIDVQHKVMSCIGTCKNLYKSKMLILSYILKNRMWENLKVVFTLAMA